MLKTTRALIGALLALTALCVIGSIPASAVAAPPSATTEAATAISYEEAILKGSVNPEGSATTYWFEYGKTTSYGTKIPVSPESVGSGTSSVLVSRPVIGLSQSTEYHFRIVAENEAETVEGEDATFVTAGFNFSFGKEGSENGQLKQPNLGIETDFEGNIWVADTENNRVEKFNSKGEYLSQFGKEGSGDGEFKSPRGLAIDPSGNIWVVDSGNNRVQKFDSKGKYLLKFGEKGSGEMQFNSPAGMTFSGTNAFVVDSGNNRVQKFNLTSTPKFLAQFGKEGSGNGEFKSPTGVVVGSAIWVTDTGNNRVQKFNASTLNYGSKFGEIGNGNGKFKSPAGIALDFQGRLWVIDSGNSRAEKFTHEGEYQDQIGKEGGGAGQLSNPTGIAVPAAQKALILDTGNNRVEGWTVKAEPPKIGSTSANSLKKNSATLSSNIDPEALATTYWFEYDTTKYEGEASHGTKIPITPELIGSGSSTVKVNQTVTGLSQGTTYHFRAVADSAAGTVNGVDKTFKLVPPRATTEAATAIKAAQATLNGKVDPESSATSYWFEYDTTKYEGEASHGTKIPVSPEPVGSGTTNVAVGQTPTGLKEGTTYHFRVVAESEVDAAQGEDKSFTTLKLPDATTEAATAIKATQAALNGKVNPLGSATKYWFEYGETTSYGAKIPISPESIGTGASSVAVSQTPTGLKEGTTYHFRVAAESEAGKAIPSEDKSFTTLKLPDATTEAATEIKTTQAALNGKVNPLGSATKYWFEYGETTSYGTKIPVSPESIGSGTEYVAVSQTPTGLNEGTTYHFRVAAESEAGIAKGADKSFTTSSPEAADFSFSFGSEGSGNGQFLHPAEIAVDSEGDVWVADLENNRIQKFDKEGKYLARFGEEGEGECQLLGPKSLAVDAEGNIWVDDAYNNNIQKYDQEGSCLFQFGESGSEPGQFEGPESIMIDAEGNIWVADTYNGRLQKFDPEGNLLEVVGSYGSEPGQLGEPTGIDIGPSGNVWVADWQNKRVSEFNEAGKFVRQFGKAGSGNGEFKNPDMIEVDEAGNVWVLDEGNKRIQRFDEEGKYLGKFGSSGSGEGQFNFGWPAGITSDAEGNLWIADSLNNRVQMWVP